jgi:rubredoxin
MAGSVSSSGRFRVSRGAWENTASLTSERAEPEQHPDMKAYMCVICGYVYREDEGDPESGISPGTRWDEVPLTWRCPDCGAGKEDFEMVEI